jgi:hypothetical protein
MEKRRNEEFLEEEQRMLQNSLRNKTKEDEGRESEGERTDEVFLKAFAFRSQG